MAIGYRILVPLDESTLAEGAAEFAAAIAARVGGELHLVSVHPPQIGQIPAPPEPDGYLWMRELDEAAVEATRSYLAKVAEKYRAPDRRVTTALLEGIPDRALLQYCDDQKCDLIVMATHGRGGISRLWLGSVADRVVRRAGVPVLLIPARRLDAGEVASSGDRLIRTVVVPLDGSELAERVLAPATALGEEFGAEYVLFRAIPPAAYPPASLDRDGARRAVHATAAELRDGGFTVTVIVEEEAEPTRGLLKLTGSSPGSLIAMATHGRGGIRRSVLGSVTDKVIRAAHCPVLVVRPSEVPAKQSAPPADSKALAV